jgi:hypothetical protein
MCSESLFARTEIYENYKTITAYIVWIRPHQHENPIIDMSSSFIMPGITFIARKPLRADTRNGSVQYCVAIGAAPPEISRITEVEF